MNTNRKTDEHGNVIIYTPQNAKVVYVPYYVRAYVRSIQPQTEHHPTKTKQGYDFFCNLDMFGGNK